MMKNFIFSLLASLLLATGFTACETSDGDADYGLAQVYMPQATVSGAASNDYPVPSGEGEYTYNFRIDLQQKQLNVFLGVIRSGNLSNDAFSVSVVSQPEATAQIIASHRIANAVEMPASIYTLPTRVNVPAGKSGESFYMPVAIDALKDAQYAGKKLVTTVAVTDPSRYELNPNKNSTVVIIDVDAILEHITKAESGN